MLQNNDARIDSIIEAESEAYYQEHSSENSLSRNGDSN